MNKRMILTALAGMPFAFWSTVNVAAPVVISNVPDWNQPTAVDNNLPDPGPVLNVNLPAAGSTAAWCVPASAANIAGYYRDATPALTIADGSAFPNTTQRNPTATDWRDDMVDDQSVQVSRQDLGWYLNANGQGDATLPFNPGMGGTHYGNILPGLINYSAAHGLQPLIVNFANNNGPAALYDTSGVPNPHRVPMAYQRLQAEIGASRPALLHLAYWNLVNRQPFRNSPIPGLPNYDTALWGPQVFVGPGGEQYGVDIGHTVTAIGYWSSNDPTNPFAGMANGGLTPDALLVFDNNDGTVASPGGALPLPVVVPFAVAQQDVRLNVPWVMQTEISGVPEPAAVRLLGVALVLLIARRGNGAS